MSNAVQNTREMIRAECTNRGLKDTKDYLEKQKRRKLSPKVCNGYIQEWIADQEAAIAQERRMNETAASAKYSAIASVGSMIIALIALSCKGLIALNVF